MATQGRADRLCHRDREVFGKDGTVAATCKVIRSGDGVRILCGDTTQMHDQLWAKTE